MNEIEIYRKLQEAVLIINECLSELKGSEKNSDVKLTSNVSRVVGVKRGSSESSLNYSLNVRAFIKRYANGKGPAEKFVLILAFLAKGKIGSVVAVSDIKKTWNKMTSGDLLGTEYNTKYPVVAKNQGWVDSPKRGQFVLLEEWKEVI